MSTKNILTKKQKTLLLEWFNQQSSIPAEFTVSNLPADLIVKLQEISNPKEFNFLVENFIRKQVLLSFK